ncbi:unnamed protein product [Urochloa humidicola]
MICEDNTRIFLECMLLDASAEPTNLPLSFLKAITDNFSDDRQIGRGGFAVVYKGLLRNGTVAVKKLFQTLEVDEKKFNQEVDSLMRVKHKNIVRFLGYCADTQGKMWKHEGKNVMAEERQRLLCFEFLPKGGLDKYISDASGGLQWRTRYQIIRGICEGLHYLHEHKIVHVDLKPANILLDSYMVPKIADFGLSKFFGEKQTHAITSKLLGSQGYMAPEFYSRVITFKLDIYSLGVVIIEILTGQKGYPEIQNLLGNWSARFETLQDIRLEHIKVCAEIAIKCIDSNPAKRPDTQRIIEMLDEMECTYGFIKTECCTSSASHEILGSSDLEKYTPELLLGTTNAEGAYPNGNMGGSTPEFKATDPGIAAFQIEYNNWVVEQNRHTSELRAALQVHASELDLRSLVKTGLSNYEHLFWMKAVAVNFDVFYVLSGMWRTPVERMFQWIGGFRPSELLKIIRWQIEPVTEAQMVATAGLLQTLAQAEDALSMGIEKLQQNHSEALTSAADPFGLQMATAVNKLEELIGFVTQADHLRLTALQQMHKILTTRMAARASWLSATTFSASARTANYGWHAPQVLERKKVFGCERFRLQSLARKLLYINSNERGGTPRTRYPSASSPSRRREGRPNPPPNQPPPASLTAAAAGRRRRCQKAPR